MANPSKQDWIDLFRANIIRLHYEDRNGVKSDRRVTLHESKINYKPSANPNKREIPSNDTTIVVWDLDKNMWRRLKLDNIMFVRGFETVEPDEPIE